MKASVLANILFCLVFGWNGLAFLVVSVKILGKLLDEDLDFEFWTIRNCRELSETVERSLKSTIFRQKMGFCIFQPDVPLLRSHLDRTAYIF